jgi:UDPglucose 6-dehydrogenase
VRAYDPCVQNLPGNREGFAVCASPETALAGADAAILVTAWPEIAALDWHQLCDSMRQPVLVDGRNILRGVSLPQDATYVSIGRHFAKGKTNGRAGLSLRQSA